MSFLGVTMMASFFNRRLDNKEIKLNKIKNGIEKLTSGRD
jgi:hypothetical protein